MGRGFGWLWAAYSVSALGTWLAFDALALVAIFVLEAGPGEVSALKAAGLAVGAVLAVPLGPWVEFRRKRPVMVATDLVRCAAVMSVPLAFALDMLTFQQLLVVAVATAVADNAFQAASGAHLKTLVPKQDLLTATSRFEATTWTASIIGPPLGGLAVAWLGTVTTLAVDAASYLLSALGIRAIRTPEPPPARPTGRRKDLVAGWRHILTHPTLRPLLANTVLVSGLIIATSPLLAVLMLADLGFTPTQYGLAFGAACTGGLLGSRLARPLAARFGHRRTLLVAGTLRACWSVWLALIGPGPLGLAVVIVVEFGLVLCMGVFTPVFATHRLNHIPPHLVARTLSAWSVTTKAGCAAMSALWGVLAHFTGARTAIAIAGVLILASPLLLPRRTILDSQSRAA
ncbi:MFS transporter [Saccharothrix variisporea]|uniref:Putative MFS family arabinose efflux permease n=1 Tax=Saccharothrix variisporea TaxID=543527 RepID=A0A495X3A6_9PSEU|nr:MFS transporter [Saccharothrix variisporea]RKT68367.1 putative MFS family arabinose efflux permease [Saccharothrix variisporea]